jgi:vancomycin resistance protein YoaR
MHRGVSGPQAATNRISGRQIGIVAVTAVALSLFGFVALRLSVSGEVYPNVTVYDVSVGGQSRAAAERRVKDRINAIKQSTVTLTLNGQQWTPTFAEVGLTVDVDSAINTAMEVGRSDGAGGFLRPVFGGERVTVPVLFAIDNQQLETALASFKIEEQIKPIDASLAITGATVTITPERDGAYIDRAQLKASLLAQTVSPSLWSINLATISSPANVRADELAPAKAVIEQQLTQPFVIAGGDKEWTITPAELGPLVHIQIVDGNPVVALDRNQMNPLAQDITGTLNRAPVEVAIVERDGMQHLVPSVDGHAVNPDKLFAAIENGFRAGSHRVDVPIDIAKPAKTTEGMLAELGITELLATGESDFYGSESGRATNVKVAAALIDGTLVPPGGEYSFNRSMGEIVATEGFVTAGATEGGIPGTSVGGGVCQVSTTVFRAALKAGMPIVERWPHAFRSAIYEQDGWTPGFDASIVQVEGNWLGGTDFRFANPTSNWLLIRTEVEDDALLKVMIYGPHTGYRVELDDSIYSELVPSYGEVYEVDPLMSPGTGYLFQEAMDGVTMTIGRRVYDSSGNEIISETFVTTYKPRGAVYVVGPDY